MPFLLVMHIALDTAGSQVQAIWPPAAAADFTAQPCMYHRQFWHVRHFAELGKFGSGARLLGDSASSTRCLLPATSAVCLASEAMPPSRTDPGPRSQGATARASSRLPSDARALRSAVWIASLSRDLTRRSG